MSKKKKKIKHNFNSLGFLNATVEEIYHRKKHFVEGKDLLNFKCTLWPYFAKIERVFRVVYGSDISLDASELDLKLFGEQFPFIFNNFADKRYKVQGVEGEGEEEEVDGITYFFRFIARFRNMNLHAVISTPLDRTMIIDETFLDCFPEISENVCYAREGRLTIAGMLIMILAALDKGHCEALLVYIMGNWSRAMWEERGDTAFKEKRKFLLELFEETFQTNYEVEVGKPCVDGDILKDIFGRLYGVAELEQGDGVTRFNLDISERVKAPRFGVSGKLDERDGGYLLTIDKGSNFGVFFKDDYTLKITDREVFCQTSSRVPPFMLVAVCYYLGLKESNKINSPVRKKLKKMERAKCFLDKGLNILCAEHKNNRANEINKLVAENTVRLFIDFEEHMIFHLDIKVYGTYSTLASVLWKLNVPEWIAKRLYAVRNFCAHCGFLDNTHCNSRNEAMFVDLKFVIDTLKDFVAFLRSSGQEEPAKFLAIDINKYILNNIIKLKYEDIFINSVKLAKEKNANALNDILGKITKGVKKLGKSNFGGEDEKNLTDFIGLNLLIKIPEQLSYPYKKFFFKELKLLIFEGEGLVVNGCPVKKTKCVFMETLNMNAGAVTLADSQKRLNLDRTERDGILTKYYYTVSEDKE